MMRNIPCPFTLHLLRIAAKMIARAMVITVTTTIIKIEFCMERKNFMSPANIRKFCSPTKFFSTEYPPHLYKDILKTLNVGRIIKIKSKIDAGATQQKIKALRRTPLFFFFSMDYLQLPLKSGE